MALPVRDQVKVLDNRDDRLRRDHVVSGGRASAVRARRRPIAYCLDPRSARGPGCSGSAFRAHLSTVVITVVALLVFVLGGLLIVADPRAAGRPTSSRSLPNSFASFRAGFTETFPRRDGRRSRSAARSKGPRRETIRAKGGEFPPNSVLTLGTVAF